MNLSDISRVIEQVSKDRSIKREIIIEALEQAVLASAKKKFGVGAQLESHYNEESGEIDLFQFKTVVENEDEIGDPDMDIELEIARKYDLQWGIDFNGYHDPVHFAYPHKEMASLVETAKSKYGSLAETPGNRMDLAGVKNRTWKIA